MKLAQDVNEASDIRREALVGLSFGDPKFLDYALPLLVDRNQPATIRGALLNNIAQIINRQALTSERQKAVRDAVTRASEDADAKVQQDS